MVRARRAPLTRIAVGGRGGWLAEVDSRKWCAAGGLAVFQRWDVGGRCAVRVCVRLVEVGGTMARETCYRTATTKTRVRERKRQWVCPGDDLLGSLKKCFSRVDMVNQRPLQYVQQYSPVQYSTYLEN